jgi:hypothetical protein
MSSRSRFDPAAAVTTEAETATLADLESLIAQRHPPQGSP